MKILVLGSKGQLGKIIFKSLNRKNFINVYGISRINFDVTNKKKLTNYIYKINPHVIINCIAYTQVDNAEKNKKECLNINSTFLDHLSNICKKNKSTLIHFSTDYVFSGTKGSYKETDRVNPINYYGYTKRLGENIITKKLKNFIIIRVSWLYSDNKNSFYSKILDKIKKNKDVHVVNDQFGFPTSAYDISNIIYKIIIKLYNNEKIRYGIYHYSNYSKNSITWYDFAKKINHYSNKYYNKNSKLHKVSTTDLNLQAKRPINSSLNIDKFCNTFNIKKKNWEIELKKIMLKKI